MIGDYQVRPSVRDEYDPWPYQTLLNENAELKVRLSRLKALVLEHAVVVINLNTSDRDQWCIFCGAKRELVRGPYRRIGNDGQFKHHDFCTVLKLKEDKL